MARIERVNYDTYIKPLEHIQKAHNDTLADMANMSQQSEILDYYLDPELDKESYNLYNNFKNEFNAQATDFAKNGYTRNNGARLLNLHRNYNRNVGNVLDAVKNREAERAEQHKLFADSNGQVVFGNGQNADEKSVDDYLRGNKGYVFQNLDEVYKYAKNQAAAASKREYKDGVRDAVRVLDNNYYKILEETGYDTQAAYEKLDAMMADVANQLDLTYNPNNDPNIDPKDDPAGLIRNMREELRRRGLENYSNEDKHKIISSFLTGTYEGLGSEPKLTLKETDQLKRAGASKTYINGGDGEVYPDNPFKPQSDVFTIQGDYSFDEGKLDDVIKDFTLPTRTQFEAGFQPEMFESNGTEGSYHICDYDRYVLKLKEKYGSDYWQNEERFKRQYDATLKKIKEAAELDDIPDSFYKWGTNVAIELMNRRDYLKKLTNATDFEFPYLNYNKADTPVIARDMINRTFNGSDIYTNVKYNAKTGEFSGKSTEKPETIRTELENAKPGDVNMWLGTMPLNGNYFHIITRIWTGDEFKTYMIPLKSSAHFSGANVTEELYKAYCKNRDIVKALNAKYPDHHITDKKDLILFKRAKIFEEEFYKGYVQNAIKESHQDITDFKQDMNAGPEWTDIDRKPIKTKK